MQWSFALPTSDKEFGAYVKEGRNIHREEKILKQRPKQNVNCFDNEADTRKRMNTVRAGIPMDILMTGLVKFMKMNKTENVCGQSAHSLVWMRTVREGRGPMTQDKLISGTIYRQQMNNKVTILRTRRTSVEANAALSALVDRGVNPHYVRSLSDCQQNCTTII
ncbi:hypothetical protein KIN20_001704 [Parelaphostrongylus tenuis]|uniref:Uncharacterized protein n=1 Tax=Parelaphostrongylus tenuis TaxID=148309 RepID=A0AAD5LWK8_PARTN|nr:hypothetical protein KIN20_001704 [Parelaphostrongylus tenuis]